MLSRKGKAAVAAGILMSTAMAGKSVAQPLDGESTPFASEQATNLPEGHVVADRFLGLIGSLRGWSDLTQEKLERAMGSKFAQRGNGKYSNYVGEMRDGSHVTVTYYPATPRQGPTLALTISAPKPDGIFRRCPIRFEDVRQKFLALGFAEGSILTDIGSSLGLEYSRGDMSFSIDAVTTSPINNGERPVLCLSTLLTSH